MPYAIFIPFRHHTGLIGNRSRKMASEAFKKVVTDKVVTTEIATRAYDEALVHDETAPSNDICATLSETYL